MRQASTVSIIVPVYNAEKYLPQCIESILAQTFSDFELLLVDDGSADGSGAVCEAFAERDGRVRVVHQENAGVSTARNHGLDLARGEWVMFSDSDDYMDPTLLERAYQAVKESGADLYIGGLVQETFESGKIVSESVLTSKIKKDCNSKELFEELGVAYPLIYIGSPVGKLYRRSCIEDGAVRFHDEISLMEDMLFNLNLFANMNKVRVSDAVLYHYRRENAGSLSSRFCPRYYEMCGVVLDRMREIMWQAGCSKETNRRFEGIYFSALCGGIINYYTHASQTSAAIRKEMIEKVAANPYVRQLKLSETLTVKTKALLFLMKLRMTGLLAKLLELYYRTGRQGV